MTSRHSTHKTSVGYTPNIRSPQRSKCNSIRTSKQHSKKPSLERIGCNNNSDKVMAQYFHTAATVVHEQNKTKNRRKRSEHSKENREYAFGLKNKKNVSPQGTSGLQQRLFRKSKSKDTKELRNVKSGGKLRYKLEETRSKKHSQLHK